MTKYLIVALFSLVTTTLAQTSIDKIYFTDGSVNRINFDGTGEEDAAEGDYCEDVLLDVDNDRLYWSGECDVIQSKDLNGLNPITLQTGTGSFPYGMALDGENGRIYWTDINAGQVNRIDLDGNNLDTLIEGLNVEAIKLDVPNNRMYWCNPFLGIQSANLDGSDMDTLVNRGSNFTFGLALDLEAGKMYWTERNADLVMRANLDGSALDTLWTGIENRPFGIAIDVVLGKIHWIDNNKIWTGNLDGSGVTSFSPGSVNVGIDLFINPKRPANATSNGLQDTIVVSWSPNQDADLWRYTVYRSTNPGFYPGPGDSVGTVAIPDSVYVDLNVTNGITYYYRLVALDSVGHKSLYSEETSATSNVITSVEQTSRYANSYQLNSNFPNPFNPTTAIHYEIAAASHVQLNIYNSMGRKVRSLVNRTQGPGTFKAVWDSRDDRGVAVASGIYFYRLRAGNYVASRKMLLLK